MDLATQAGQRPLGEHHRSHDPNLHAAAVDVGYDLRIEATYIDGVGTDTAAVEPAYRTRAAPSTNSPPDFGASTVGRSVAEKLGPGRGGRRSGQSHRHRPRRYRPTGLHAVGRRYGPV